MILYYCLQIKEDGIWHNDETYLPIAVRQNEAHLLLEIMVWDDDERLIRIEKFEAVNNCHGRIFWARVDVFEQLVGVVLSVDVEPLCF